ncbi:MAG TPA: DUF5655 domain-containing protein [Gemmatales bacterium]|nr:DUF5655 domain-containing protein [Gemmatales bacterium]
MAKKSIYSVHPSVEMTIQWIASLKERTGRSLEEWMKFIKKEGPTTEHERREWLKAMQKMGTNNAHWFAARSVGKGAEDEDPETYLKTAERWVEAMFEKKPLMRPLYEAALKVGISLGADVKVCPCQTMVPFYRKNQFAKLVASTKFRLDLGLCLRGVPFSKRLTDTGGTAKKDRITHNIAITSLDDLDVELKKWWKKAYEMDA